MHHKRMRSLAWQTIIPLDAARGFLISGRHATPVRVAGCCQGTRMPARALAVSPQHSSRRSFLRFSVAASCAIAAGFHVPEGVNAVCGDPDPYFAHYLDWAEGLAEGPKGRRVHFRCVGSRRKERKAGKFPVMYIGDAGVGMAAGESFELLGESDRRIIFADLLGVGDSDKLAGDGFNLSRADAVTVACEEILAVLAALGIGGPKAKEPQSLHVVASGFGLEVADALLHTAEDVDVSKSINVKIASVAAEGWTPVKATQSGEITFAALQGTRVCAVEGAEAGDIAIMSKLYESSKVVGRSPMVSAIERISKRVPTLALRTFDSKPLDENAMGTGLFKEHVLSQAGRIAHLAGAEDTMKAVDDFFTQVEGPKEKT